MFLKFENIFVCNFNIASGVNRRFHLQSSFFSCKAGDSSQDEEEEVKAVTVKFARQETAEQKSRRMQSYDYRVQKQKEENWVHCTYWKTYVS